MRKALICAALALAAAIGASAAVIPASSADGVVLDAVVGTNDGFDISLNGPDGKRITRLAPGTYTIVVHDRSRLHNFHLASNEDRTVDFRTELEFVGDQAFTVTFKDGVRYVYACEPHWQTMFGDFVVSSAPATTTQPTTTATPPPPAKLTATVSRTGTVSLRPLIVRRGRVRMTVVDRSARANFHLVGPGLNRRTGRAFVGSTTWSLTLRSGTFRFGSDPRLTGRLHVH
jgi:plastocyanin